MIVGADGWAFGQNFGQVFAGVNLLGQNRIYAVTLAGSLYYDDGCLLSYSDDGKPGNVGHPVVVGKGIWMDMFAFLFAGANAAGQHRIYGVNKLGQLLSYAPTNPVSNEVIVGEEGVINGGTLSPNGNPGWPGFVASPTNSGLGLCVGVNSVGQNRVYGVYS